MTVVRRFACTLGALALTTPAVIGLSTGTALAQAVTSPSDGTVYSQTGTVNVTGVFNGCSSNPVASCPSGTLSVTDPTGASAGSTSKTASHGTSTTTLTLDVPVTSTTRNGSWTVVLRSGSSTSTTHFYTNVAPATPSGFDASSTSGDPHDVVLQWVANSEPDLQSYTLYDGNGTVLQNGITPGSACSGSTCHYALYYDNPKPGTYSYDYQLSASRAGGCSSGSCAPVESRKTGTRSASLTTPTPPPSPTPQPTQGGGSTGGSTSGGTTSAGSTGGGTTGGSSGGTSGGTSSTGGTQSGTGSANGSSGSGGVIAPSAGPLPTLPPNFNAKATALNFGNFSAALGIPKLPPLPDTTVSLPGGSVEASEPQGSYNPTLPYKTVADAPTRSGGVLTPIANTIGIDPERLAKALAVSLILIMCAAHLRRWIGAHVDA